MRKQRACASCLSSAFAPPRSSRPCVPWRTGLSNGCISSSINSAKECKLRCQSPLGANLLCALILCGLHLTFNPATPSIGPPTTWPCPTPTQTMPHSGTSRRPSRSFYQGSGDSGSPHVAGVSELPSNPAILASQTHDPCGLFLSQALLFSDMSRHDRVSMDLHGPPILRSYAKTRTCIPSRPNSKSPR